MLENKVVVGISQGDINGIGLEVILKTLMEPGIAEICVPVLFSSQKTVSYYRKVLGLEDFNFNPMRDFSQLNPKKVNVFICYEEEVNIEMGKSSDIGGKYAYLSLEKATQALKKAGFMQENAFSMKSIFKNIANLAVSAAKAVAGIPFVGPVLAAAAAAGAYMLGKKMLSQADGEGSKADDMFSGGGYGKRTLMGPEGAIKLNDKDDIIAGTDLFGKGKKGENAVSGGDGAVVAELQRVSSLLQQLLAKEGTVVMDGQKIGQALVLGSYKTQ
jgi:hypothetical protein